MPTTDETTPLLRVTVSGDASPGASDALLRALGAPGATVLDVEEHISHGHLSLVALLRAPDVDVVGERLAAGCEPWRLQHRIVVVTGDAARGTTAVVTVLADPLTGEHLTAVSETLAEHDARVEHVRRISRAPVTALELRVTGADVDTLRRPLALTAAAHGVDLAVGPAGLARHSRRLLVMDVDSTLIRQEVIELLAAHAGREAEVAAVTERAMRGELDFAQSLHERVRTLAGLPVDVIEQVRAAVELSPGARTLVSTLKELGWTVAVVSGGFIEVVQPLADELGVDHAIANRLEVQDQRLTGRVLGDVVDRAAKAAALRRFAALEGLPLARTVAVGDGANDLDMLAAAGLGIAFNAKPAVREQADASITVPHLDAVLPLLGIGHEDLDLPWP